MEYNVIKEFLYGDCRGEIYTRLVHDASERFLDAESLKNFCRDLWIQLYRNDDSMDIIFCMNQERYWFNPTDKYNTSMESMSWYRIYEDNNCTWCDLIKPIKEEKIKKVIFDGSDCCACIYSDIIKEIAAVISEPDVMHRFANELFKDKEKDNKRDLYISANTSNYVIADTPVNIEDYYCGESNRYYHYYAKDKNRDDSDMMFVEIEWKGNQE